MEATAIQSVEKNITMVALANVQPSNYNPRKNFDEASLAELSESIRQQGVLQPIGVRPIEDNRFEIGFLENADIVPPSWQDWRTFRLSLWKFQTKLPKKWR